MRTVATYGIKGGVGKTSAAVNLATLAAQAGRRNLLWDLDPQGAAGYLLQVEPKVKGGSIRVLTGRRDLDDAVKATGVDGLDLLPADITLRGADHALGDAKRPDRQLGRLLKTVRDNYDLVLLDCPPGLSRLSENVFGRSSRWSTAVSGCTPRPAPSWRVVRRRCSPTGSPPRPRWSGWG